MAAKNGKAKLVGVMGDPIQHSLSPAIHEYWLRQYDVNGAYVPLHVKPEHFSEAIHIYKDTGFVGFNVTLPHKETAYGMMDTLDQTATICKAVNTITICPNGSLHGMNTDVFGFAKLLETHQPQGLAGQSALIIGAGGAARAVVTALLDAGLHHLTIANRTMTKAETLCKELTSHYPHVAFHVAELADLEDHAHNQSCIVNTLSLHAAQAFDAESLIHASHPECLMLDISYGQGGTEFTKLADQAGRRTADGLMMLFWQAIPGFEQWFGLSPVIDQPFIDALAGQI